ncbi:MAG TPA: tetratricopeptide repeat protein, partial [Pyrinomonadaceae bacterium]|nr:tetratricopeptide repeat protein [Pyrinomonadaceae bacterium]
EWYAVLERDRSVPDDKIRAKVAELVRGREGERAKVEALYEYVAKNFRYVSLSLGRGRYQPHAAADVLANQYGDCKDKHTLLAAMLRAAGLRAYPALINSERKIDAEVPSPAQFDHVISAIPLGGEMLWVDTTTEVAPFRLLSRPLRDKHALLITGDAPARLETTPADPPFPVTEVLEVEGKVNELGTLSGRSRLAMRGDNELLYRLIFRRTPASDWKHLGRFLALTSLTYGLEVSDIKPGDPAATDKPFEVEYDFSGAGFMDWSSKKAALSLPLPSAKLPGADAEKQEESGPIKFEAPGEITRRLKLTLPAAYTARAPLPVTVTRDYAEYRSQYKLEGNTLVTERTLRLRVRELPASRAQDYLAFVSSVRADEAQNLFVEKGLAGAPSIPDTMKVEELLQTADAAVENDDNELAVALLRRVLEKEPQHKTARRRLGRVLYALREYTEAVSVLREQTRINPFDDYSYYLLGYALWRQQNYAEAEAAFRKQLEVTPLHKAAQGSLGQLLVEWRKYKEAVPELEKAITLTPEDETLFLRLGSAYLHLGQHPKATEAFGKAVELAPGPQVWNSVAYSLAVADVQLEKARQYAESAVTAVANELRNVEPERLTADNVSNVTSLAAYWDTLGWVYYRQGELELAERYVTAAWLVGQHSEVGDHLGLIHEKRGRPEEAARTYALAAVGREPVPEPRERLEKLVGKEKAGALLSKAKEELAELSTVKLAALLKEITEPVEAEFFIVFAPDGPSRSARAVDVRFVDGSEKLRPLAAALKGASYRMTFPGDTPTRLIRHGTLTCRPANAGCAFVMTHPDDTTAPN